LPEVNRDAATTPESRQCNLMRCAKRDASAVLRSRGSSLPNDVERLASNSWHLGDMLMTAFQKGHRLLNGVPPHLDMCELLRGNLGQTE